MVDLLVFGSAKVVIFMEKGKSVDKKIALAGFSSSRGAIVAVSVIRKAGSVGYIVFIC